MNNLRNKMSFFSDVRALIVCKILGFSQKSAEILQKKIVEKGGEASIFRNGQVPSDLTHIIAPSSIPGDLLREKLGAIPESVSVVSPEWCYNSLSHKSLEPEFMYVINLNPTLKRKIQEEEAPKKKPILPPKLDPVTMVPRSENLNEHITKEFEILLAHTETLGDRGRFTAYANVIRTLKLLPFKVTHESQLENVKTIGAKSKKKIQEILRTGTLCKNRKLSNNKRVQSVELLTSVFGIGPSRANSLFFKGIENTEQLKHYAIEHPHEFSRTQMDAIMLNDEFLIKIPRNEVEEIGGIVRDALAQIDKNALFEVCGSYRRGREMCGDVDIVIGTSKRDVLEKLVVSLGGLLTHIFSKNISQLLGVFKLHELHRRFDIFIDTPDKFPFMLLAYTGSRNYNRLLRLEADKKGLHLSHTGIREIKTGRQVLHPASEEDIVEFLGFPLLTLTQRDI